MSAGRVIDVGRRRLVLAAGSLAVLAPARTQAQSNAGRPGPRAKPGHVAVELMAEVESVQPGRPFWLGLSMLHDEKWHTYWKNPGDAGIPPSLSWTLPPGLRVGEIEWPHPYRYPVGRLASYGYEGLHLLPLLAFPGRSLRPGASLSIRLAADWLVCKESCIPEAAELVLELPVRHAPPAPGRHAARFVDARARLPRPVEGASGQARLDADGRGIDVRLRLPERLATRGELFFDREDFIEPGVTPRVVVEPGAVRWSSQTTSNGRKLPAQTLRAVWVPGTPPAAGPRAVRLDIEWLGARR
ncbi:MAG TPA: protein-disulfide reductase DsbD domain-containing protein [Burkholderiaceae bacterium]|nr:protein-disulfide reductase DsbD domain-containing protein [Burkholderiaceae bacterium]